MGVFVITSTPGAGAPCKNTQPHAALITAEQLQFPCVVGRTVLQDVCTPVHRPYSWGGDGATNCSSFRSCESRVLREGLPGQSQLTSCVQSLWTIGPHCRPLGGHQGLGSLTCPSDRQRGGSACQVRGFARGASLLGWAPSLHPSMMCAHVYGFERKLIKQRILMSCFKYLSAIYPTPTVLPRAPQLRSPISPRFLLSTYLLLIGVLECLNASVSSQQRQCCGCPPEKSARTWD